MDNATRIEAAKALLAGYEANQARAAARGHRSNLWAEEIAQVRRELARYEGGR